MVECHLNFTIQNEIFKNLTTMFKDSIVAYPEEKLEVVTPHEDGHGAAYSTPRTAGLSFRPALKRRSDEGIDGKAFLLEDASFNCYGEYPLPTNQQFANNLRYRHLLSIDKDTVLSLFFRKAQEVGKFVAVDIAELFAMFRDFAVLPGVGQKIERNYVDRVKREAREKLGKVIELLNDSDHHGGERYHSDLIRRVVAGEVREALQTSLRYGRKYSNNEFAYANGLTSDYIHGRHAYAGEWIGLLDALCHSGSLRPVILDGKLGYELTQKTIDDLIATTHCTHRRQR
jgi:hypothetical protein